MAAAKKAPAKKAPAKNRQASGGAVRSKKKTANRTRRA